MYLTMALHRNLQQQPDVVATICGDRVRTHRESAERVPHIDVGIGAAGTQPGERIAILALNSDRYHEVLLGGENVYSIEVENIIATHPSVASCAVVGVPDEKWGETVHAVVVLAGGTALTIEELRSHCAARLAGYKCPTGLSVVPEMPLSGAGKILKRTLRERLASSA
ncbi:MAG: AMP-binding enzyme [Cumulibacter sp.]